ncbi:MAG: hypothetical protein A3H98_14040 [Bacteroidetes bacterium RIFCSPLOWO2_02_FULL_36_8]|nr:MAG: hypothetical protein A3H98_14040 [Bacteroidetes bacterium RIFCSPLOWO2_02_FULL_36_8]OFY68918.1 MAG: hypothetical protein A3G23_03065 [Bacteroidetes bacterium RIFCSPLOWO2_12_FULL_37_12]
MFLRYTKYSLLWAFLIFVLCLFPGKYIPSVWWLELLSFDKLVHAGLFFILVILMTRGFSLQQKFSHLRNYCLVTSFYISVFYGGALELMQGTFFSGRTAEFSDFIANAFGCAMAGFFYKGIEKRYLNKWVW